MPLIDPNYLRQAAMGRVNQGLLPAVDDEDYAAMLERLQKEREFNVTRKDRNNANMLETWPAGEEGTPDYARPEELPLDKLGLEINSDDVKPKDVVGDLASHDMAQNDPNMTGYYREFERSLTPEQHNRLQEQYQWAKDNEGEQRPYQEWYQASGLPAYFRGGAFKQWDNAGDLYTPEQTTEQRRMLEYLKTGTPPAEAASGSPPQDTAQPPSSPGGPEMKSYDPSWREKLGSFIEGDDRNPGRRWLSEKLLGRGEEGFGGADLIPGVGNVLELNRSYRKGDPEGMGLAIMPVPGAAKGARVAQQSVEELNKLAHPFFSRLREAVTEAPFSKAPGKQWLGYIEKQRGVKPEEIEWTKFREWATDKPSATKEEVSDYLRKNQVWVSENLRSGTTRAEMWSHAMSKAKEDAERGGINWNDMDKVDRDDLVMDAMDELKYSDLGDDYAQSPEYSDLKLPGGKDYQELTFQFHGGAKREGGIEEFYDDEHWGASEPVNMHVRFQEKTDAEGRRLLHIEEIQSQQHQRGRKHGYGEITPEEQERHSRLFKKMAAGEKFTPEEDAEYDKLADAFGRQTDAPFKKTWQTLALKRMQKWAADHGYDGISWSPAAIQIERYGGEEATDKLKRGMTRFYDEMLPIDANKLGKEYNSRVGETTFPNQMLPHKEQFDNDIVGGYSEQDLKVPMQLLTPKWREKLRLKGNELFEAGSIPIGLLGGAEAYRQGKEQDDAAGVVGKDAVRQQASDRVNVGLLPAVSDKPEGYRPLTEREPFDPISAYRGLPPKAGEPTMTSAPDPTIRQSLGRAIAGDERQPGRQWLAEKVTGGTGMGEEGAGAMDLTPLGNVSDALESYGKGDYTGMGVAMIPGMPAARAGTRLMRRGAKEAQREARRIMDADLTHDARISASRPNEPPPPPRPAGAAPDRSDYSLVRFQAPKGDSARFKALEDKFNTNPEIAEKLKQLARDGEDIGRKWYDTEALRDRFMETLGEKEGDAAWREYMTLVGMTSPGSKVLPNIKNASYYYVKGQELQGIADKLMSGKLKPKKGSGYGHKMQGTQAKYVGQEAKGLLGPAADPRLAPKPRGFNQSLIGSEANIAADMHFMRLMGMMADDPAFLHGSAEISQDLFKELRGKFGKRIDRFIKKNVIKDDTGKASNKVRISFNAKKAAKEGPKDLYAFIKDKAEVWDDLPGKNEYAAFERITRKLAKDMDMTPAQFQASLWMGAAKQTKVDPSSLDTFVNLFNKRLAMTAEERGSTPEEVWKKFAHRKEALAILGLPAGAALQDDGQSE